MQRCYSKVAVTIAIFKILIIKVCIVKLGVFQEIGLFLKP